MNGNMRVLTVLPAIVMDITWTEYLARSHTQSLVVATVSLIIDRSYTQSLQTGREAIIDCTIMEKSSAPILVRKWEFKMVFRSEVIGSFLERGITSDRNTLFKLSPPNENGAELVIIIVGTIYS